MTTAFAGIRRTAMKAVGTATIFFMLAPSAFATTYFWIGNGAQSDRWENGSNWSLTPAGGAASAVPGSADVAVFRNGGVTARMRSAVVIAGLYLNNVWTGSLLQGTGTLTIGASGFKVGGGNFVGSGSIGLTGGYTQTGGTVISLKRNFSLSGSLSITGASSVFTSTGTIIFSGTTAQTATVNNLARIMNVTVNNASGVTTATNPFLMSGSLTVSQGSLTLGTATTIGGNVVVNGTSTNLIAGSSLIIVAGNWTMQGADTFKQDTSTVRLNGSNQTLSGSTTFYNLVKNVTSADTLTFIGGQSTRTTNLLTLNGAEGATLSLRKSGAGRWNILPDGNRFAISYVSVADSNAVYTINCTNNCTDASNNVGWIFPSASTTTTTTTTTGSSGGGGGGGRRTMSVTGATTPAYTPSTTTPAATFPAAPKALMTTKARIELRKKQRQEFQARVNQRLQQRKAKHGR